MQAQVLFITAHKNGKSCEKCNPNKEDLKLKKKDDKKEGSEEKLKSRLFSPCIRKGGAYLCARLNAACADVR